MDDTATTSWRRLLDSGQTEQNSAEATASHPRILIVDNDMRSAESLELMLHASGCPETCVAYSGGAALAMAAVFQPSVAMLDIDLLDMTGYELAESLLAETQRLDLQFVALTSACEPAAAERARAAGFDRYLVKPVTARHLSDFIETLKSNSATSLSANPGVKRVPSGSTIR